MDFVAETLLPLDVATFLDGSEIEDRVGATILLSTCSVDAWPQVSLLSVGEVLAVSRSEVRLALYAGSRTASALQSSRRGLLVLVRDGAVYKVRVHCDRIGSTGAATAAFRAEVVTVEVDRVDYARVVHGIEYELVDREGALDRWRSQLTNLKEGAVMTGAGRCDD
jgi:hypothetical protein